MKNVLLVILRSKENMYSFNTLLPILDDLGYSENILIIDNYTETDVKDVVLKYINRVNKIIFLISLLTEQLTKESVLNVI